MTFETRTAQFNGTTTVTTTLTGGAADSTHGMIAFNKAATSTLMTPTAGSIADGWVQVGSMLTFGTNQLTCWKRRGNGAVNSISFTAGGVQIVTNLIEYAGVYDDDFVTFAGAALGSAGTSLASGTRTTTEDGQVGVAYLTTGTGSSSAHAFSNSYAVEVTGSAQAWADRQVATSGTNAATTATWTTSRTAALGVALLRVTEPVAPGPEFFLWTGAHDLSIPLDFLGVKTA